MKRTNVLVLGTSLLLALGSTASANAQMSTLPQPQARAAQHRGWEKGRHHGHGKALFRGISLSADQRARVKGIHETYKPQFAQLRAQYPNRGDTTARAQFRALREREWADERGVLNTQQQSVFDQNIARQHARMHDRRQDRRTGEQDGSENNQH